MQSVLIHEQQLQFGLSPALLFLLRLFGCQSLCLLLSQLLPLGCSVLLLGWLGRLFIAALMGSM